MEEQCSLIPLFQSMRTIQGHASGYKYKIGSQQSLEIDPVMDSFTDFTEGILSYINSTAVKFYNDKQANQTGNFNPTNYSFPLYERVNSNMLPVIVDLRFKFLNGNNEQGLYNRMFIYKCVYYLQDIILGCFKVDSDEEKVNKTLICFFLESDKWTDGEYHFINMRFQFPYARINIEYLNRVVIPNFRKCLTENNDIKKYITETPVDSLNLIVPQVGEYVCMYGSKEKESDAPLFLKSIYSFIHDPDHIDLKYDEQYLPFYYNYGINNDILVSENSLVKSNIIDESNLTDNKWFNLPLILSIFFTDKILKLNEGINISEVSVNETKTVKQHTITGANTTKNPIQMLGELIPLISKSRFTSYYKYYWYSIGKAIYNICNGTPYGLKLWENYTDDIELKTLCKDVYDDFQSEILDIRTIKSFAHADNKVQYDAWLKSQYEHKLLPCLSGQSLDVADLVSEILGLDFVYDRNNDQWYYFNGTRLVIDRKAYMLINFIHGKQGKVVSALNDYRQDMISKSNESGDRTFI